MEVRCPGKWRTGTVDPKPKQPEHPRARQKNPAPAPAPASFTLNWKNNGKPTELMIIKMIYKKYNNKGDDGGGEP